MENSFFYDMLDRAVEKRDERLVQLLLEQMMPRIVKEKFKLGDEDFPKLICMEFPFKKTEDNGSANADFLLKTGKCIYIVELKTNVNDTAKQLDKYLKIVKYINNTKGTNSIKEYIKGFEDKNNSDKFENLIRKLGDCESIKKAKLLYIVPNSMKKNVENLDVNCISFGDIGKIYENDKDINMDNVIAKHLARLDGQEYKESEETSKNLCKRFSDSFLSRYLERTLENYRMPIVQAERYVGAALESYIGDIVKKLYNVGGKVKVTSEHTVGDASEKVDFLVEIGEEQEIKKVAYLVELKTSSSSFSEDQLNKYCDCIKNKSVNGKKFKEVKACYIVPKQLKLKKQNEYKGVEFISYSEIKEETEYFIDKNLKKTSNELAYIDILDIDKEIDVKMLEKAEELKVNKTYLHAYSKIYSVEKNTKLDKDNISFRLSKAYTGEKLRKTQNGNDCYIRYTKNGTGGEDKERFNFHGNPYKGDKEVSEEYEKDKAVEGIVSLSELEKIFEI